MQIVQQDLRTIEAIQRFDELGITTFPTVAINGKAVYESVIPPQEELVEVILSHLS